MRGKRRKLNLPREGYFCPVMPEQIGPGPSHPEGIPFHMKGIYPVTPQEHRTARAARKAERKAAVDMQIQRDLEKLQKRLEREGKAGVHNIAISSAV